MPSMQPRAITQAHPPRYNPALADICVPGHADFPSDVPVNAPALRKPAPVAEPSVALW